MDRALYKRYWNDDTVNIFRIYLAPGAVEARCEAADSGRIRKSAAAVRAHQREVRRYIMRLTDQWFGITYVQIAVAVLVAVLGIVNTLTVSITDRRRELGVLQAVGGLRSQIRRTIWLEALAVGPSDLILGLALGAAATLLQRADRGGDMGGIAARLRVSVPIALLLVPGISAGGVSVGDRSGGKGGARVAGGGARI